MKVKAIRVPLESYIYLQQENRIQRTGKELSEKVIERFKRSFETYNKDGALLLNGSLGGANEEGKWTSWTVEDMKDMLNKQNLPYENCEEDVISVRL